MFLKIFLWFWLAIAVVVGVLMVVTAATNNEPSVRTWRTVAGEAMLVYAENAADAFERAGAAEVQKELGKTANDSNFRLVVFDSDLNQIAQTGDVPQARETAQKIENETETYFEFPPNAAFAARRARTSDNRQITVVAQLPRPRSLQNAVEPETQVLRILAVILTAGAVCYALARYLTSPLTKLRQATMAFADGDLSVRVAGKIGKRRDEISSLARDFDVMAARIENLIAAQKNLTSDISHELRSPLARLGVALEIARKKSSAEAQPILDRIEREAARLNEMIGQLLLLSKLEAGAQAIEKYKLDLSEIVVETVSDADFEARSQNKTVELVENESCFVRGDAQLLRSAIENVVRNAVRHTPEKTAVEVALKCANGNAVIAVRDWGAGVPAEDLDKLFRPFYRVGYARERNTGNFGLGLAITERSVAAHNGTVTAQNAPDGGLLVKITVNGER